MADQERPATVSALDVVQSREHQRRRQVLRPSGGGHSAVSIPDGEGRGGRKAFRDALRPWTLDVVDADDAEGRDGL